MTYIHGKMKSTRKKNPKSNKNNTMSKPLFEAMLPSKKSKSEKELSNCKLKKYLILKKTPTILIKNTNVMSTPSKIITVPGMVTTLKKKWKNSRKKSLSPNLRIP
jgi:hypothetical protein